MAYGLYKGKTRIIKISGNPRSKANQKNLIVWDDTKAGVIKWVKNYGTQKQKNDLGIKSITRKKRSNVFNPRNTFNFGGF